jgi:hypothetical protein
MSGQFFFMRPLCSGRMSSRSCRCIPLLAGLIPWRWTDAGNKISLSHAERIILVSPACSSLANIAANLPESRITLRTAGLSLRCCLALNLQHIFCEETPSGPRGPHAVSKALRIHWRQPLCQQRASVAYICKICPHSTCIDLSAL